MVSRATLFRLAVVAALAMAAMFSLASAIDHMWANLVVGVLVVVASAAVLVRPGAREERAAEPLPSPGTAADPLSILLDQVPIPLLKFAPRTGLHALNLAARTLFRTDTLITDAPASLVEAIQRAEPGMRPALRMFERSYAVGISEVAMPDETVRLVSLTDIQSEVRAAEATALRDLLRVLSHEIMNSLTPVASLADTARRYLADQSPPGVQPAIEALDVLSHRAAGLSRFVEAYRSLARLPDPVVRPVALFAFLRDVVRVFEQSAAARDVTVELEPSPEVQLDLDETLLAQALLNVLTNAAEATPANPDGRRIHLSAGRAGGELWLRVADNGPGVPPGLREQIFHAFVTTKATGTGTGLNLARQIALAHGGDLVLQDGTGPWNTVFCFVFRLPDQAS